MGGKGLGKAAYATPMLSALLSFALFASPLTGCTVTDGDTIRCGEERIRISGIDAPETRACRQGRICVPGDGAASTRALESAMEGATLTIRRLGRDRYGRTLGVLHADGVNLACAQLAARQAYYIARWDNEGIVAADCPALAATRSLYGYVPE